MKNYYWSFFLLFFLFLQPESRAQLSVQESFDQLDTLYARFLREELIMYDSINFNQSNYVKYNAALSANNLNRFHGDLLKAHLINAYNFTAIKLITRFYPIENLKQIKGIETKFRYPIAKEKYSLAQIRERLMKDFPDPRLAFSLNNGTLEKPGLYHKAFRPENLNETLDHLTQKALNDSTFVLIDSAKNQLVLSPVFKDYKNEIDSAGGLLYFINQYRETPVTFGFDIVYRHENLMINDQKLNEGNLPINLQNFTPSILLTKGLWEYRGSISLYTSTKEFYYLWTQVTSRASNFVFNHEVNYGLTHKLNIGLVFSTKNVLDGGPKTQNPINVLYTPNSQYFRAMPQYIGSTIKWRPINRLKKVSLESMFLAPIAKDFEGLDSNSNKFGLFVDWDSYIWRNDILNDFRLSSTLSLFTKYSFIAYLPRNSERYNSFLVTPISANLAWFTSSKFAIIGLSEFWFSHTKKNEVGGINFNSFSPFYEAKIILGLSANWQVTPSKTELALSYLNDVSGTNHLRSGSTFKVALKRFW